MSIICTKIAGLIFLTAVACFWGHISRQTAKTDSKVLALIPAGFSALCVGLSHFLW